jgi:hypothetical protein
MTERRRPSAQQPRWLPQRLNDDVDLPASDIFEEPMQVRTIS